MPSPKNDDKMNDLRRELDEKVSDLRKEVDAKISTIYELRNKDVSSRHDADLKIAEKLAVQEKDIGNIYGLIKQIQDLTDQIATLAMKATEAEKGSATFWKLLKWTMWVLGALIVILLVKGVINVSDIVEALKNSSP